MQISEKSEVGIRHFDEICEDERLRNSNTSGNRAPVALSKALQNQGGGRSEVLGEGRPGVFFGKRPMVYPS